MSLTTQMLRAYVDAVLKPLMKKWVTQGLPIEVFGATLVGYGIAMLRGAGWSEEQILEEATKPAMDAGRDQTRV